MKFNTKFCVTKKKKNCVTKTKLTFEFSLISIDNRVIQTWRKN